MGRLANKQCLCLGRVPIGVELGLRVTLWPLQVYARDFLRSEYRRYSRKIRWKSVIPLLDGGFAAIHFLCDFDGTISKIDVGNLLTETLGGPGSQAVEDAWKRNEIGSQICHTLRYANLKHQAKRVAELIESVEIDSTFLSFLAYVRQEGHKISVVSDGMDLYVDRILGKYGIDVPRYRNELQLEPFSLKFPFAHTRCRWCATCKAQVLHVAAESDLVIFIGDGLSDRYAAYEADLVYAKDSLAKYMQEVGQPYRVYQSFADIEQDLRQGVRVQRHKKETNPACQANWRFLGL